MGGFFWCFFFLFVFAVLRPKLFSPPKRERIFSHNCAIHTALLAIRLYRDRVAGSRLRGADRINIFFGLYFSGVGITSELF